MSITIVSILSALSTIISTIVHSIAGVFGRDGGLSASELPKDAGSLKLWLNRPTNFLKTLFEKIVEALPYVVESIVSAILRFFFLRSCWLSYWTLIGSTCTNFRVYWDMVHENSKKVGTSYFS